MPPGTVLVTSECAGSTPATAPQTPRICPDWARTAYPNCGACHANLEVRGYVTPAIRAHKARPQGANAHFLLKNARFLPRGSVAFRSPSPGSGQSPWQALQLGCPLVDRFGAFSLLNNATLPKLQGLQMGVSARRQIRGTPKKMFEKILHKVIKGGAPMDHPSHP